MANLQLTGTLVQVLSVQKGVGKNGEWKKQDIIIQTEGQFPKKVCVTIWGDKVSESVLQEGKQLNISFDIESREYNGRWYTDVKAWKVEPTGNAPAADNNYNDIPVQENFTDSGEAADDLPF